MTHLQDGDLEEEIHRLYSALKNKSSASEVALIINSILLHKGATKDQLAGGWDRWFEKLEGTIKKGEQAP